MSAEGTGTIIAPYEEAMAIESVAEAAPAAVNQNGHAAALEVPDFYGPFLTPDQMRRPNPRNGSRLTLELGEYVFRLPRIGRQTPNDHGRFIINSILHEQEGGVYYSDLIEGPYFFPSAANLNSKRNGLSIGYKKLLETINHHQDSPVITRSRNADGILLALAPDVEVVRMKDDELRERIRVVTSKPATPERTSGAPTPPPLLPPAWLKAKDETDELILERKPANKQAQLGTEATIDIRQFEDYAYKGTRAFVLEEADELPVIETTVDKRRFKAALASLSGEVKDDAALERYRLANERLMEYEKSEIEAAIAAKQSSRRTVTHTSTEIPVAQQNKIIIPAALVRQLRDEGDERHWQDEANCMGVDPDLFFPERGASTREAKAVCRSCEVRVDCLDYALANGEKFGIWGGHSERERRRLRRQRNLARRTALDES